MNLDKLVVVGTDSETIPAQNPDFIEALKVSSARDVVLPSMTKTELLEALKDQPYPLGGLKVDELKKIVDGRIRRRFAVKGIPAPIS